MAINILKVNEAKLENPETFSVIRFSIIIAFEEEKVNNPILN